MIITNSNKKTDYSGGGSISSSQSSYNSKKATVITQDSQTTINNNIIQQQKDVNIFQFNNTMQNSYLSQQQNMQSQQENNINMPQQQQQDEDKSPQNSQNNNIFYCILQHKNSIKCLTCTFFVLSLFPIVLHIIFASQFYQTWEDYFDVMGKDLKSENKLFFYSLIFSLLSGLVMLFLGSILFLFSFTKKRRIYLTLLTLIVLFMLVFIASALVYLLFTEYSDDLKGIEKQCNNNSFDLNDQNSDDNNAIEVGQQQYYQQNEESNQQQDQQYQKDDNSQQQQQNQSEKLSSEQLQYACPNQVDNFLDMYNKSIAGTLIALIFYPILQLTVVLIGNKLQKNLIKLDKNRKNIINNNGNNNSFRAY